MRCLCGLRHPTKRDEGKRVQVVAPGYYHGATGALVRVHDPDTRINNHDVQIDNETAIRCFAREGLALVEVPT